MPEPRFKRPRIPVSLPKWPLRFHVSLYHVFHRIQIPFNYSSKTVPFYCVYSTPPIFTHFMCLCHLGRMFKAVCRFSEIVCSMIVRRFSFSPSVSTWRRSSLIIAQTQFQISFCRHSGPSYRHHRIFLVYGT